MKQLVLSIAVIWIGSVRSGHADTLEYGPWMNSGDIAVQYGHWIERACTTGQCISPTQVTPAPSGFAKGDMVITGFEVNYVNTAATRPVALSAIALVPEAYDATAGAFRWHLATDVRAAAGGNDAYQVDVHFAIVLSDQVHAVVNDATVSCGGNGGCTRTVTHPGFVPNGLQFDGYGFRSITLQAGSAGIAVYEMAQDASSWHVVGNDSTVTLGCTFRSTASDPMRCAAGLVAIATATASAVPGTLGVTIDTATKRLWTGPIQPGFGNDGVLVALDRYDLRFDVFTAHNLWGWEAAYLGPVPQLQQPPPSFITFTSPLLHYARRVFLGSVLNTFDTTDTFYATIDGLKIFLL
jgi:hypothetical protein